MRIAEYAFSGHNRLVENEILPRSTTCAHHGPWCSYRLCYRLQSFEWVGLLSDTSDVHALIHAKDMIAIGWVGAVGPT